MTVDKSKLQRRRTSTLDRVLFFYLCTIAILTFTLRFTKNLSAETAGLLSIFIPSVLTFLLVVLFTRWEKLSLADVGRVMLRCILYCTHRGFVALRFFGGRCQ
jgi:uncharacterized protein